MPDLLEMLENAAPASTSKKSHMGRKEYPASLTRLGVVTVTKQCAVVAALEVLQGLGAKHEIPECAKHS